MQPFAAKHRAPGCHSLCGIPSPVHWARSAKLDPAPESKDPDSETCSVLWASDYAVDRKEVYFVKSMAVVSGDRTSKSDRVVTCMSDLRTYISCIGIERHLTNLSEESKGYTFKIGQLIFWTPIVPIRQFCFVYCLSQKLETSREKFHDLPTFASFAGNWTGEGLDI